MNKAYIFALILSAHITRTVEQPFTYCDLFHMAAAIGKPEQLELPFNQKELDEKYAELKQQYDPQTSKTITNSVQRSFLQTYWDMLQKNYKQISDFLKSKEPTKKENYENISKAWSATEEGRKQLLEKLRFDFYELVRKQVASGQAKLDTPKLAEFVTQLDAVQTMENVPGFQEFKQIVKGVHAASLPILISPPKLDIQIKTVREQLEKIFKNIKPGNEETVKKAIAEDFSYSYLDRETRNSIGNALVQLANSQADPQKKAALLGELADIIEHEWGKLFPTDVRLPKHKAHSTQEPTSAGFFTTMNVPIIFNQSSSAETYETKQVQTNDPRQSGYFALSNAGNMLGWLSTTRKEDKDSYFAKLKDPSSVVNEWKKESVELNKDKLKTLIKAESSKQRTPPLLISDKTISILDDKFFTLLRDKPRQLYILTQRFFVETDFKPNFVHAFIIQEEDERWNTAIVNRYNNQSQYFFMDPMGKTLPNNPHANLFLEAFEKLPKKRAKKLSR